MKTSTVIPLSIIIGGLIVGGAIYFAMPKPTGSTSADPAKMRPIGATDHILGNPAAKVMIVEYSDFDCRFCKDFDTTMHQLIADKGATGQVAWVFRQFPLTEIHPDALALAQASECAAQTGGNSVFWNFEEALYQNQPADPSKLGPLAAKAGVPGTAFATCMSGIPAALTSRIMADRQNAFDVGAIGTPFSLIVTAGKAPVVVDGAYSYDALKGLVDQALGN